MGPFCHILSSYIPYGKGLIGREGDNYSPIEKWNERSGYLDGQWMFIDNYLTKLGSRPIPHSVDSVSCSSILLKEMLLLATIGPNPRPNYTANTVGWSSNHYCDWRFFGFYKIFWLLQNLPYWKITALVTRTNSFSQYLKCRTMSSGQTC